MTYRILLIGGGSGGHIYPLLAVAQEFKKTAVEKGINLELMAVADSNFWREDFIKSGIKFKKILAPKLRKVEGGRIFFFEFLKIPVTLIQSLWLLFLFMPDFVFSKGGFASVIPSLIARLYFIPLFIHESDSIPGKTNKLLAKFAKKIFVSFETTKSYFKSQKTVLSGNPVRENLLNGDKNSAVSFFNFDLGKKTILVLAGSQGSSFINRLLIDSLVQLAQNFQVIHQTGDRNFNTVEREIEKIRKEGEKSYGGNIEKNYRPFGFLNEEELRNAYAAADLIVSRSGSNIFEISALGKPAIVIPYPYSAGSHQRQNALEFSKFGAIVLEEANLKPHILLGQIEYLLKPENYDSISRQIKNFSSPDSGKIIAQEILSNVFRQ